jgi:hypothetical protein
LPVPPIRHQSPRNAGGSLLGSAAAGSAAPIVVSAVTAMAAWMMLARIKTARRIKAPLLGSDRDFRSKRPSAEVDAEGDAGEHEGGEHQGGVKVDQQAV